MMKVIRLKTILLALLVSASFVVLAQDGVNKQGDKNIVNVDSIPVKQQLQVELSSNADQLLQNRQHVQPVKDVQPVKEENERKNLTTVIKKLLWKFLQFIFGTFIVGIAINLVSGKLQLNLQSIFLYLGGLFFFCPKWRNWLFCHGDFAKQIPKTKIIPKNASLREKIKNTYIHLQGGGYPTARSILFPNTATTVETGIFIVGGQQFSGRQFFLENELVKHEADVFKIEESKWLIKKNDNVETTLNKELVKRLLLLCRKLQLSIGGYSHKVVILLAETLSLDELHNVVNLLTQMLVNNNGPWSSINYQNLTLILKTNISYVDDINLDIIKNDYPSFKINKLDFDHQDQIQSQSMFLDSAWDKKLQDKIKEELEKSQYFHKITLSNGYVSSPLATAIWVNTFGQPGAINYLYQIAAVTDNEHWKNTFSYWKIICNRHDISLENFLAFLWLIATLRNDNDTSNSEHIMANIAHGHVKDERWLNWENRPGNGQNKGLKNLLHELWGKKACLNFNFLGNMANQLDDLEWAVFLMKMIENDEAFINPIDLSNVYQEIINNLPYFTSILGGENDKSWEEYKELIASNLIEACIKVNRLEVRDTVFYRIVKILKNKELYNGEDCTRLEEIAETLLQMRMGMKHNFDILSYLEENWGNWSALERNDWLNIYLKRETDSEYLMALFAILPFINAFSSSFLCLDTEHETYLELKVKGTDCIFDLSGELIRVFMMPVEGLSVEDKIRKYILMKTLEIIFNDSKELNSSESYIGSHFWKDKQYIAVPLNKKEKIWSIFIQSLKELHNIDDNRLMTKEREKLVLDKCINLIKIYNNNDVLSQSIFNNDLKRLIISAIININFFRNYYCDQTFLILEKSNILIFDEYLSNYVHKILEMKTYLENTIKSKKLSNKQKLPINNYKYCIYDYYSFVFLVNYYLQRDSNSIENCERLNYENIYTECLKCLIKFKNIKNNIKFRFLHMINCIIMTMNQTYKFSQEILFDLYNENLDFIYYKLDYIHKKSCVFELLDLVTALNIIIESQEGEYYENLKDKIYQLLSLINIYNPNLIQEVNPFYKQCLDNFQSNICKKKLSTSLGELVYQEIKWIFNNKSSITTDNLHKLYIRMNDLEFFNQALNEFSRYKLNQDNKYIENVAFLLCIIASLITKYVIIRKTDVEKYIKIFWSFLLNEDNPQHSSLYQLLINSLVNHESMQHLNMFLAMLGIRIQKIMNKN